MSRDIDIPIGRARREMHQKAGRLEGQRAGSWKL